MRWSDMPGVLNVVEINSSFHRHHREQTYETLGVERAEGLSILGEGAASADTRGRADTRSAGSRPLRRGDPCSLGSKLGVLLVQLPPKLAFDRDVGNPLLQGVAQTGRVYRWRSSLAT